MKHITNFILVLLCLTLFTACGNEDDASAELSALNGTWQLTKTRALTERDSAPDELAVVFSEETNQIKVQNKFTEPDSTPSSNTATLTDTDIAAPSFIDSGHFLKTGVYKYDVLDKRVSNSSLYLLVSIEGYQWAITQADNELVIVDASTFDGYSYFFEKTE